MGTLTNAQTMTQAQAIRAHLLTNGWIDKPTAMALCDCDRLGARIWDLRHDADDPLKIRTVRKSRKNRLGHHTQFAVYELEREGETT